MTAPTPPVPDAVPVPAPDTAPPTMTDSANGQPKFYANRYAQSIYRTWDWTHVDQWNPVDGWFFADPGEAYDEMTSPQWYRIQPEEAQVKINRWGGEPREFMDPATQTLDEIEAAASKPAAPESPTG